MTEEKNTKNQKRKELPSHIDEYFTDIEIKEQTHYKELFSADDKSDLDLKTDVTDEEIKAVTTLHFNDKFLHDIGVKPIFTEYYNKYMRLKISKDRKSRGEYVDINKKRSEEIIKQEGVKNSLGVSQ